MKQLDGTGMKRLHREWRRRTTGRLSIVLDSVQNPYNVGSILRTAAALRVDHIWFAGGSETPAHAKTQKTALGADRYVTWTETADVTTAADQARASGLRLVGLELADEAQPLHTLDLTGDICLVVGHEDRGLSKAAIALCDTVGYVPLLGKIGSLNVAMAASVALYEIRRQAWTATPPPS
jgi:tRNA (guanosine-2'-O-)-methyltransferase